MPIDQGLMLGRGDAIADHFDTAAANGFDYVELNMEAGYARHHTDPTTIAEHADANDLDVVVHLPYRIDPCSPHEHARDGACTELEAALDAAAGMGAHRAITHADTNAYPHVWDRDHIHAIITDVADRLASYGDRHGIDVAFENLDGAYHDISTYTIIADATPASLCLDTGHALTSGYDAADQATFIEQYGDNLSHIHLNDTRDTTDDEHLPVGLGTIDFERIVATLQRTDWTGTATHEIWSPTGPTSTATAGKPYFDSLLTP